MTNIDTTQSALLAAIRANPADDAPRLIYADWLDENATMDEKCHRCGGDGTIENDSTGREYTCPNCNGNRVSLKGNRFAERAEFIRRQCEFPTGDNVLCGIDGEYSNVHWHWAAEFLAMCQWNMRGLHRKVIFRRGFVAEVRLTLAEFLRHAKAIAAVHPVQTWVLTNREPEQFQAGEWAYYVSVEDYRNPDNITHKSWLVPDFYPLISKENVHRFTHRLTKFRSSKEQAIADLQQFCYRWARGEVTE